VGERVGDPVRAGEGGQQRGVGVDGAAAEPGEERRSEDLHEPGGDDQVRIVGGDGVGEGGVPGGAVDGAVRGAVVPEAHDDGFGLRLERAVQGGDAGTVGDDGDDLDVDRVGLVEQGLEEGPGAGGEDDDARGYAELEPCPGRGTAVLTRARVRGQRDLLAAGAQTWAPGVSTILAGRLVGLP
jgi:hypothetical protein